MIDHETQIKLVNGAKERMTTRTQELLDTFFNPEEIDLIRKNYKIESDKAHEAAIKAGAKLHPRIAKLKETK